MQINNKEMSSIIVISRATSNEREINDYCTILWEYQIFENLKAYIYIYIYMSYYNFHLFFQDIHLSKRSKY